MALRAAGEEPPVGSPEMVGDGGCGAGAGAEAGAGFIESSRVFWLWASWRIASVRAESCADRSGGVGGGSGMAGAFLAPRAGEKKSLSLRDIGGALCRGGGGRPRAPAPARGGGGGGGRRGPRAGP